MHEMISIENKRMSTCHKCRLHSGDNDHNMRWNKIAYQWLCIDCNDEYLSKLDEFNEKYFEQCEVM